MHTSASSFFAWLEDEDYIIKSPVRRIHKVKTPTIIKETLTDEYNNNKYSLQMIENSVGKLLDISEILKLIVLY